MLDAGLEPTVFEVRRHVGGLWAPHEAGLATIQLNAGMKTNSSLFTTAFADYFPFTSASAPRTLRACDVGAYLRSFAASLLPPDTVRLCCRVTSVAPHDARWLVSFHDGQHAAQQKMESVEGRKEGESEGEGKEGEGKEGEEKEGEEEDEEEKEAGEGGHSQLLFDFVVVACGMAAHSYIPHADTLCNFKGTIAHSIDYSGRRLFNTSSESPDDGDSKRKHRILVVGGRLSGAEVPADIALHASSLPAEQRARVEILHLVSRPFWSLPRMLPFANPADAQAPRVLPLDQVIYDAEAVLATPPAASPTDRFRRFSEQLVAATGSDQAELGPALHMTSYWREKLPHIGISESYAAFVRAGAITPIRGRFAGIAADGRVRLAPPEDDPAAPDRFLPAIDAIVFATGYTPWPALRRIFPPDLLRRISVDPPPAADPPPHLVHQLLYKQTIVPELAPERNLAFIGIQPRPFWAVLEVQARRLAAAFTGRVPWPSASETAAFRAGAASLLERGRLADALLLASQGGYLEIVVDECAALGFTPLANAVAAATQHGGFSPKTFITAHLPPAAAPDPSSACEHRARALDALRHSNTAGSISPPNVARAVFNGLHGRWRLSRTLRSALAGFPSGRFEGHAVFHPRLPTFLAVPPEAAAAAAATTTSSIAAAAAAATAADGAGLIAPSCGRRWTAAPPVAPYNSLGSDAPEYLYSESGELTTTTGARLPASRKYIYQCDGNSRAEPDYTITAWFVKPGDAGSADGDVGAGDVDYFFHDLDFSRAPEDMGSGEGVDGSGGWKAASEHLCGRDWYFPAYRFLFNAIRLERFWIRYRVIGPAKDYVTESLYVREG